MTAEDVRLLYEYNSWANRRLLEACAAVSNEEFTRDIGSSFKSLRATLVHIFGGEWLWLERFHGRSHTSLPAASEFPDLPAVRRRAEEIDGDLRDYVASLTDQDIQRDLPHKNTAGEPFSQPLWQLLQHLVNHGTYHRGQVTTMLRQLGATSVSTDLVRFYRERAAGAKA